MDTMNTRQKFAVAGFILAGALLLATFALGIWAIWSQPGIRQQRLVNTATLTGFSGLVVFFAAGFGWIG